MKKGIMIGIFVVILCFAMLMIGKTVLTFVGNKERIESAGNAEYVESDVTKFTIGNKAYWIRKGELLSVNAWDDEIEVEYNGEYVDGNIKLFNGIEIGSTVEEVIEKFDLKSGYANINMEVPTEEHDGTTDVINVLYESEKSFGDDFLDAMLQFGYKKTSSGWKMVKFSDIESADILFYIDINGFTDEEVDENSVVMIYVQYGTE